MSKISSLCQIHVLSSFIALFESDGEQRDNKYRQYMEK